MSRVCIDLNRLRPFLSQMDLSLKAKIMHRSLRITLCSLLFVATACTTENGAAAQDTGANYKAGVHYSALSEAEPPRIEGKVEVIEFFLYTCRRCYSFEPHIRDWLENKPEDVVFTRVPATFSSTGPLLARTYYTAQALGVLEDMHPKLFRAIHEQNRQLNDKAAVKALFVTNGVDGTEFDQAFDSFTVDSQVRQADALSRRYDLSAVPSMGVDGQYYITTKQAGGYDGMLQVVNHLVRKQEQARGLN